MSLKDLLVPTRDAAGPHRRWWWLGLVALLILAVIAVVTVWRPTPDANADLAGEAVVTASSTGPSLSARDIVTSGSTSDPGAVWQSDGETIGAWVELSWSQAQNLRQLTVVRNSPEEPGMTTGVLSFEDGSFLQFALSATSPTTQISFTPRMASRVRMTVTEVEDNARHVTIAEIIAGTRPSAQDVVIDQAPDGNAALSAVATQSAGSDASNPRALQDGSGAPGTAGIGAVWTANRPLNSWVQLEWAEPRELTSVAVVGSADSPAALSAATLTFGDGAQLPIGAVLADPNRPTIVSFMPRVTRSIRLTLEGVAGSGGVALSELRAYQRGAVPVRTIDSPSPDPVRPVSASCGAPEGGRSTSGVEVRCPQTGSVVTGGSVDLQVSAAPGYSSVIATVWPGEIAAPAGPPVEGAPDPSGLATLTLDAGGLPPGPFTVHVQAKGPGRPTKTTFFQLYRGTADSRASAVPSSVAARGRSLVFAEEFNEPVSITRTGYEADYAASKPTHSGAEDFGDAIFLDPGQGFDTVGVVDSQYLRVNVQPAPAGLADPQGWGRTRLGGLLSSARQGGSGFSAQYGYFEARMLAPAAPGTWPAFWMLPSDNLIKPRPVVAEIDAVELYGHDPTGGCHSTHEHGGAADSGVARCGKRFDSERAALSWHTYGASVTPTDITFFIDGRVVATAPQVVGGGSPMFFMANLALGGGWPVDLRAVQERAVLYVDYVRVFV
jgi:hypothetical protein